MQRNRLLHVLRLDAGARDALNWPAEGWTEAGRVYAGFSPAGTDQQDIGDASVQVSKGTFRVRDNALTRSVTTADRVRVRGVVWRVTGNDPVVGKRGGYRDITAVQRSADND
ncbi:head-tail adaptor protein [Pseudooceanicola sp. MF1-13]|uniref:phage head completion protein n=1 Tax=Pseudooceanicola sp. MF1-13 TaxID=3379095 RepID=UPI003892588D